VDRQLIHPYSDADACSTQIKCIKLEEALADKLKCLLQRRYCYDIFDLVYGDFLSRDIAVHRAELLNVFLRKTIFGSSPGAAHELLVNRPVDLFRGYWGKVVCPAVSRISFNDAIATLRQGVNELFAPYASGMGGALAFYPSHLRNPILEAGSDRRLLRLTYDGVRRTVEPYSLAFKRTQAGQANEYLYVWDRVGGRTTGPGTKQFFHYKIHDLEILDETFGPRFPIELAKAGDSSQAGYFTQQSGRRVGTGVLTRCGKRTAARYIIQCPYCGKQFRRTTSVRQRLLRSERASDHLGEG
jgi:hypothetical protein